MRQNTLRVSLREVLRHAFASLPEWRDTAGEATEPTSVVVSVTRTSEDRSRMRQIVIEELARRRQQSQEAKRLTDDSGAAALDATVSEPSLFGIASEAVGPGSVSAGTPSLVRARRVARGLNVDVRELVATAYRSLFRRPPEDHVVLNPRANAEFIVRCRDLGATTSECALNRTLLNIRKSGWNTGLDREPVAVLSRETFDRIGHAVEIAASLVQRECDAVSHTIPSVDDILCSPELRQRFGTYVTSLQGGVDIVDCHLALLAFRKSGRAPAVRLAEVEFPERTLFATFKSLDPHDVPDASGVYRLVCKRRPVFVGGTANLRQRLLRHLEHAGEAFLPDTIPFEVDGLLGVEVFKAPPNWRPRRVEAVARSMRIEDYPPLNWREKSTLFAPQSCVVERRAEVG